MAEKQLRTFQLPGSGLVCGACQTPLPSVADTRQTQGLIIRKRLCPSCGKVNETIERVFATRDKRKYMDSGFE